MLSFNYQAPIYTFMSIVDNINYLYEEVSANKINADTNALEEEVDQNSDTSVEPINCKGRILTCYRNDLLVVNASDIAFIYKENAITYVVTLDGKRSITNDSLDSLFEVLDHHFFFRVNRQIIVRVSAIKRIIKMGSGLKVETHPSSENLIIVGKNKTFAFKKWLNG
ncbi:LytR/AlgR family response regulator transcription factor [Hyunsoonleella ulvae]|uniref:LytR/AlgR family response regulator transcription factor n=1 Tax=Hyunsoonleella ulvae TaxID=2799948 RepID=UPI00193AD460|nr:LytTR family DNA-binding domain-containing protein [Hyunsoonleella ulvae]